MRVVGVNGINTYGGGNIDVLLGALKQRGLETIDVPLPRRTVLSARWSGCADGQIVADASRDGDVVVAHSYGCLRAWHAHRVRDYRAIICIAPAMSRRAQWSRPGKVHCWHSRNDWAIRIGSVLIWHPFGAAGNVGFDQVGVVNRAAAGARHNDYFRGLRLQSLVHTIRRIVDAPDAA